jgi:hypothetical protein
MPEGSDALAEMRLLLRAFQISKMLGVAAALRLADRIGDTPLQAGTLAQECGAHPEMLLRLCRALSAFGIFSVDDSGNIAHTARSRLLRSDSRPTLHHAARYWTMPSNWAAWAALEDTVRTGKPAFETVFGVPNFAYLEAHPDEAWLFDSFMQHSPDDRHQAVVEAYDFSAAKLLVDVGGGNGGFVKAALAQNRDLRAVLFDQKDVVAHAAATFGDCAGRCAIEAGDFFERVPHGGDLYVLCQILHDWNDERCLRILRNCRAVMHRGARLLVIERVLDLSPGKSDPTSFLSDMDMMVLFPGAKERTLAEFAGLFRQSGFAEPRLIPTRSAFSIVETAPSP